MSGFPRSLVSSRAVIPVLVGALACSAVPLPALGLSDLGSPTSSTVTGPRTTLDLTQVSTSQDPAVTALQNYRQFPFVLSIPTGSSDPRAPRTLLMSYNVNTDAATSAPRYQTKRSTDGGVTWTNLPQGVPLSSAVRTDTGLIYSADFRTSSTGALPPAEAETAQPRTAALDAAVPDTTFTMRSYTSTDNGVTWSTALGTVTLPWSVTSLYFHRGIVVSPRGEWLAPAYGRLAGSTKSTSFVLSSTDQGRTWRGVGQLGVPLVDGEGVDEPSLSYNSRGQLLAAYRMKAPATPAICRGSTAGTTPVAVTVSNDDGRTWSAARQVSSSGIVGSAAPQLVLAPTGQMLLSTGRPFNQVLVSPDGTGDTWSLNTSTAPIISSGYTSLVPTGRPGGQLTQFGDLGSNWCFTSADGSTRPAGIFSVPFFLRPVDGRTLDLREGFASGRVRPVSSTFTGRLSSSSRVSGLGDGSTEGDTGVVATGASGTVTLDLGNYYDLRGIGLAMPALGAHATADVSSDGVTWRRAAQWGASNAYRSLTDRTTTALRTRYLRLTAGAATQALISELRLYTVAETFEGDVPGTPPAGVRVGGTNALATVTTVSGQGYQSGQAIRIQDSSTESFPYIQAPSASATRTLTSFMIKPTSLQSAVTITHTVKLSSGAMAAGFHTAIFPDGSVRRYSSGRWIVVAPAGSVRMGAWTSIVVSSSLSSGEIRVNGATYSGLPLTTQGGQYVRIGITAGGTKTVGDDFLIDYLNQS